MSLADARALHPALATLPAAPEADRVAVEELAARMVRFTPSVAPDPPHGLILDITGCAHLFGGEAALAAQVVDEAGFTARHAFADNPFAARALARFGGDEHDLRALPVAALELEDAALTALRRAGLRSIGDLAGRSRASLAARFGEAAVTRLQRLLGEAQLPLDPQRRQPPLRAGARLAEPVLRSDDALEVVEALLGELAAQMAERAVGGRRFVVQLERSDGAKRRLAVETGLPTRDPAAVMRLLRERIDTLSDPLDPGFGFDAIALAVTRSEPLAARQASFEEGRDGSGDTLAALIDRLRIRLGADRVRRLSPCDRHLPELAQALEPVAAGQARVWPAPDDRPPRPLLLFDPPQPVEVIAGVPDGPPQRFRWKGSLHEVTLSEGPERIGAEWWRRREGHYPGGSGPTRDYYRIEDSGGRRYWLFRHGLFTEKPDPRWYLHGLFP